IFSNGQGTNKIISEALKMQKYAMDYGIPI
ncbi:YdcF family protein, partial [Clostridium perfringens]|nr:YdcF family protein [Clostridium perfringens]